jgi:putative ABC transport system permease protein
MPGRAIGNATNTALPQGVLIFLGILCFIIILSACLNYTNLSMARSLTRAKEVGIRKVSGASRKQIFSQFIAESVLVSLISLAIAFFLLMVLQPLFTNLWLNRFFNISFAFNAKILVIFLGFSLLVGLIAGLLPAIYISVFNPTQIFKSINSIRVFKGLTIRKVLLVVQFAVSLIFIVSAILIYAQTVHVFNFNYGFNKDNVVNVKLYRTENFQRFAQSVRSNPDITAIGACSFPPSSGTQNGTMVYKSDQAGDSLKTSYIDVDQQCLNVWDIKLVAGKNLPDMPADQDERYVLINEKMVSAFRYPSATAAIGQRLLVDGKNLEIVGVVRDFQFLEVNRGIEPLMLRNRLREFGYATVRIKANTAQQSVAFLQESWKKVNPNTKFEYAFFDSQLRFLHSMMKDAASIIGFLALLAVLVACLGLLGMAVYTAETRRKEVGVRKVLGSSAWQLMMLLSRNYLVLMAIAILLATPIAYLLNDLWLRFFVSRVTLGPPVFLLGICLLSCISLGIVFSQAWRVSKINPVKSLRAE